LLLAFEDSAHCAVKAFTSCDVAVKWNSTKSL